MPCNHTIFDVVDDILVDLMCICLDKNRSDNDVIEALNAFMKAYKIDISHSERPSNVMNASCADCYLISPVYGNWHYENLHHILRALIVNDESHAPTFNDTARVIASSEFKNANANKVRWDRLCDIENGSIFDRMRKLFAEIVMVETCNVLMGTQQ